MGRSYGMLEVDDDELEVELDVLGDDLVFDEDFFYFDDVVLLSVVISELGGESMKEGNVFVFYLFVLLNFLDYFVDF